MSHKSKATVLALMAMVYGAALAQDVQFYGVRNTMRYDDGEDAHSTYLGWDAEAGKAIFEGDYGLWSMNLSGSSLTAELAHYENLMYGNSGSLYINGTIYTVFSHEDPDATEEGKMEFVVRKWDATTYELLSSQRYPKSANIESRGMAYNPVDGKVYGLFYLTDVPLDIEELDKEDIQEGYTSDAGYAICTIDLETMEIAQITPGIYYDNFVTLACSPEGRLYSMSAGGTLYEFSCTTGLIVSTKSSGVKSQFKRQSACFDHRTGKMYWNGYVNNGMGYNEWGSYGPLPDREWRTNGKFDTALYEVDINTGVATQIALVPNRIAFSCLWVNGGDGTETSVRTLSAETPEAVEVYNLAGQRVLNDTDALPAGLYVVNGRKIYRK